VNALKQSTRTILEEIISGLPEHNRNSLVESRGNHIVVSALNFLESIKNSYGEQIAEEIERRLLSSIKNKDPKKFSRATKKIL
jgi:hypothetical protein